MKPPSSVPFHIRFTIAGLATAFLLALALAALMLVWNARQTVLAESEQQVTRFANGSEAALNRALLAFDVLLASTEDLTVPHDAPLAQVDALRTGQALERVARQNLLVRSLALLDAQGGVVASSDNNDARVLADLPPEFFRLAMGQTVSTLVLSAPTVSFTSTERVFFVARRLVRKDGEAVLAIAQVPAAALVSVLTQGVDIAGLQVTLERGSGELLLGVSDAGSTRVGWQAQPLEVLPAAEPGWAGRARLNGTPALVVPRVSLYPDVWISASLPLDAALTTWRAERNAIALVAVLFGLTVVVAGFVTVAYLDRMHRARAAIAESKATLDQALSSMVSGFVLLNPLHQVVQWNRRFEEVFPWLTSVVAVGVPFRTILEATVVHHLPTGTEAERRAWVDRRVLKQHAPRGPHEQVQPDGRSIQITERPTPQGGLVITYHDVTDLRRATAEIETLAFYDPLTGLPNRRLLLDRLTLAAVNAARTGEFGALLFLDLDHFKTLNDTLGHEVGDLLLQQVAQRLKGSVRAADTVARLGGDEFVIMLCDLAGDAREAATIARRVAEKALQQLGQPYELGTQTHYSNCSIGATVFGHTPQSAAELLKQADIAMYQVKAERRGGGLCFFDPQMQVAISQRAQLEADLQTALVQQQFVLHYQPQYTLQGAVVGAEALLRWQHPERGVVPPGQFIAAAEESELIVPIGLWVLRTACLQLAAWQHAPHTRGLTLAVNVSARQFRQPDFVPKVVEILQSTGVRPHLLKLELTESLVLDNVDDSIAKMHLLRTKGVRFAVDDFGTGYSSLAYLTRLPLHQLKIDQSFVRNLGERHTDDVIVQTIIGMARTLELEVIAEGVETAAQRDFLAEHGCDLYQGYLFGRPMPLELLQRVLDAGELSNP